MAVGQLGQESAGLVCMEATRHAPHPSTAFNSTPIAAAYQCSSCVPRTIVAALRTCATRKGK